MSPRQLSGYVECGDTGGGGNMVSCVTGRTATHYHTLQRASTHWVGTRLAPNDVSCNDSGSALDSN